MKYFPQNIKRKNSQKKQRYSLMNEQSYFYNKRYKFAIKSKQSFLITPEQLEMIRRIIVRNFKKRIKFWLNLVCNTPLTKKPIGIRMGKGKGKFHQWVFFVKKGRILIELDSDNEQLIKKCFNSMNKKLPAKLSLIQKDF